jgi:23S rRNA (cytosine1962-C5)-methyltransferase
MAELILQPQLLLGEGWGDYGLVDRATDASWSAMAPSASSAPSRRPCGSRAAEDWDAHGEFVPGADEDGGGRWSYTKPCPATAGR